MLSIKAGWTQCSTSSNADEHFAVLGRKQSGESLEVDKPCLTQPPPELHRNHWTAAVHGCLVLCYTLIACQHRVKHIHEMHKRNSLGLFELNNSVPTRLIQLVLCVSSSSSSCGLRRCRPTSTFPNFPTSGGVCKHNQDLALHMPASAHCSGEP